MRRLVIAPHMDDESLGCGGLIAKHRGECAVVVLTDSGPQRAAEHQAALAELGLAEPSLALGFPDGDLPGQMRALVAALDEVLAEQRPDEVYLPFPSLHQDHIAAYEAGMRACRLSMSEGHWFPPGVLVYDIAAYDVNLYQSDLRWNVFETLTEQQVRAKAAACAAYGSEIPDGAHPMRSIVEMAAAIGTVRKVAYAEQYALVRSLRP
ncbi:MAG TPA: PIG-L family deacetylase [Dermatophilaceae bacterium]|nr:PIG-L family deacetylase [Dermatophilaceae bacterium]